MANAPSIVLVDPQMGENIGAAARIMWNFAMEDLRIVRPRDGWPNQAAIDMSKAARHVLDTTPHDTVQAAVADRHVVYAMTARQRDMLKPHITLQEWIPHMQQHGGDAAVLFGSERSGLENEDISLADVIVSVPVNPAFGSLNLAQSVALVCYEWSCQQHYATPEVSQAPSASKDTLHGFFNRLEHLLEQRNFYRVAEKKPLLNQKIRTLFGRATLTDNEVQLLHGIIRCLSEGDAHNN